MAGKHYTAEDEARIRELHQLGYSAPKIAKEIGRPVSGIRTVLYRLGLVAERSAKQGALRKLRQMSRKQHDFFTTFVKHYAGKKTPGELVLLWNTQFVPQGLPEVTYDKITHWVRKTKSGVVGSRKLLDENYPGSAERRRKRIRQKLRAHCDVRDEELRVELCSSAKAVLAKTPKHPQRVCNTCGDEYPLQAKFFHHHKQTKKKVASYSLRCRLCERRRRRWVGDLRSNGKSAAEIRAILKRQYRLLWEQRSQAKRAALLEEHNQIRKRKPTSPSQTCAHCQTDWLLRPDAYCYDASHGSYSKICLFCDRDFDRNIKNAIADGKDPRSIRKARREALARAYDAIAAAEHQSAIDSARHYLAKHPKAPSRFCPGCRTRYPFNLKFFRRDLRSSFQYVCRWCRSSFERLSDRLRDDPALLKKLRTEYRQLLEQARDYERAERNADTRKDAARILRKTPRTKSRVCPCCEHRYPLTEEFWRFNKKWTARRASIVLDSKLCVCCLRDSAVAEYRLKKVANGPM